MKIRYSLKSAVSVGALLLGSLSAPALAQEAEDEAADNKEIVVTGSLIRGSSEEAPAPIDVIGGEWLTEINVTSPTGIVAIDRFNNSDTAGMIWDAILRRIG